MFKTAVRERKQIYIMTLSLVLCRRHCAWLTKEDYVQNRGADAEEILRFFDLKICDFISISDLHSDALP